MIELCTCATCSSQLPPALMGRVGGLDLCPTCRPVAVALYALGWTAPKSVFPKVTAAPPKLLDREEWNALRAEENGCDCTACWNRYVKNYGPKDPDDLKGS